MCWFSIINILWKCYLFSLRYSLKIAHLMLNNNHSLTDHRIYINRGGIYTELVRTGYMKKIFQLLKHVHPVTSNKNLWSQSILLTKIMPEYSDILYNTTHFPGPLVCQIKQVPLYLQKNCVITAYKTKTEYNVCQNNST